MNSNWKKYFHIDSGTSTDQSDNEDEIEELMNDSDIEFIAPEEVELTNNPENARILTPEANVHVVDQGITHTKELETIKKRKKLKKIILIKWKHNVSPHS